MNKQIEKLKHNGLFVKMFLIMVVTIIAVSITTTWTTIRVSERVFMETFSITNTKIIDQINHSMDAFNYSIVQAANTISQSGVIRGYLTEAEQDSLHNLRVFYRMDDIMHRIASGLETYEVEIKVAGANGRLYTTSDISYLKLSAEQLKNDPLTQRALEEPRKLLYQHVKPGDGDQQLQQLLVVTKPLLNTSSGDVYGMIYFIMPENKFARFYEAYTSEGNDVIVMNKEGMILSSSRKMWTGQEAEELMKSARELEERNMPYENRVITGKEQIVLSQYLPLLDLYVVNLIDKKQAIGELTNMKALLISIVVIVGISLIIVFTVSRRMTKSLTRLVKQISTISKYEFDHKVSVGGSYETRQLGLAFNAMIDELQEYVKKLVQTEKEKRNAELEALQGQINPHFLYNTLASVKFMVQQGSRDKAADTINALISLLQNVVGNISETIPLSQELVNMRHYVLINHVRYGERIKVHYFISPDCMGYHVPKLIIQPFIENAFFHGFNRKTEGHIYFMASKEGHALVCEIVDDGDGFAMDKEDGKLGLVPRGKRQLFTGIGVHNVHDRLKLLYGDGFGLTISSEPGEGTRVKIRIPLLDR
ncbi:cache domain-containing sensor histidine kinase [Paenibacillus pinihumi]|uniref:cache domain-containing sensor histidine kinase n=1 Tax=Paenibacillus pinihumi TaxID=669462 RepID=UPI00048F033E|nr:sensor histidine kinase [Paenibacillus pinihumi]